MVARWCSLGALLLGGLLAAGCAFAIAASSVRDRPSASAASLSTPMMAALIAIVDQGRALKGLSSLDGPSQTDSNEGFFTAIPNDVQVLSAVTKGSVVTVNFNGAFAGITGGNTELAVAQVVATVVLQSRPGTGVIFEIEGAPTSVPIASGVQVQGPVYLWQFLTTAA